ncbi:unnamed protein product [Oikopleura dioica]|uniref:Prostamide/prostaglandin F synthase n=1 Tax=Oikopleura dioica TaxID=34765 RepID=E4XUI9_OIKDI|nr:unnamed protein product [Oikopleura dioica]
MSFLQDLLKLSVTRLANREKVELKSFIGEKPTVLFFIRRFGCPLCRYQVKDYSRIYDSVSKVANFVVISPEFLGHEEFTTNGYWPGETYIDEKKECYSTIGFKRYNPINVMGVLFDKQVKEMNAKAQAQGITGNMSGDKLATGGVIIVDKEGKNVLFEFKQKSAGDHCEPQRILDALKIDEKIDEGEGAGTCGTEACGL